MLASTIGTTLSNIYEIIKAGLVEDYNYFCDNLVKSGVPLEKAVILAEELRKKQTYQSWAKLYNYYNISMCYSRVWCK